MQATKAEKDRGGVSHAADEHSIAPKLWGGEVAASGPPDRF